jgi:hypothetical protein
MIDLLSMYCDKIILLKQYVKSERG